MSQTKFCVRCSKQAELVCSRCNDSYCSSDCQKADWIIHRTICFKMPPLVRDVDILEQKLSQVQVEEAKKNFVPTVKIGSNKIEPKSVSPPVPPRTPAQTSKTVHETMKAAEVTPVTAKKTIESKQGAENNSNAPRKNPAVLDEVKPVAPKLRINPEVALKPMKIPAVAREPLKMIVKNTEPEKEKKGEVEMVKEVKKPAGEGKKTEEVKKPAEEVKKPAEEVKKPAEEVKKSTEELNKPAEVKKSVEEAKTLGVIQPVPPKETVAEPQPKPKPLMLSGLNKAEWPTSKNVQVKIIAHLEGKIFTFTELNETIDQYYDFINTNISEYCKDKPEAAYLPIQGEVVFALFEDNWYRAHVLDPHPVATIVQFIDYGNMSTVKPKEMMPNPMDMKFDICARDFTVDNFPEELTEKQLEILASGAITITSIHQDSDNLYHCKIFGF